jgi:hypothetical protein
MILAVDPDVIYASDVDRICRDSLWGLYEKQKQLRFAVDSGEIQKEYLDYYKSHLGEKENPAIIILDQIIQGNKEAYIKISSDCSEYLQNLITQQGCTTKVEPELLGMAENERGLVLYLVGDRSLHPQKTRHRGLHDPRVKREIGKFLTRLDVRFACDTKICTTMIDEAPEHKAQSRIFELLAKEYIQEHDQALRCTKCPGEIREQIDVYASKKVNDTLSVIVGECKLWQEGNEDKKISVFDMRQLERKVLAVEKYYFEKIEQQGCIKLEVEGRIISNAIALDDDAFEVMKSSTASLAFWRADLPRGWSRKADWHIKNIIKIVA